MNLIIGVTGGIGSGKSFVANLFASLGVPIIDADRIAHTLTARGGGALEKIVKRFGTDYLTGAGELDRAKLRQAVFSDPRMRADLEAITHPLIRDAVYTETRSYANQPYVMQVIPLLVESGHWQTRVDRVLVVDCPEDLQISRVMQRSQLSRSEVIAIMAQQVARAQRLACANDIIDNSDHPIPNLFDQIQTLHQQYLALAYKHARPLIS